MLAERNERVTALGVIAPPPIHINTPTFDGSLATLFAFVRDHKVDLLDVPLFPICEAYFSYLLNMPAVELDEAAAALSALAYLLERKAWLLLPVPDPEPEYEESIDPPEPTSHEYKMAIEALAIWQEQRDRLFFRSADAGPDPYELPYTLKNVSPSDLALAFERLLKKAQPEPVEPLNKPRKSLEDQMTVVLQTLTAEWATLDTLVEEPFTRFDAVYWFLALLELMRLGRVQAQLSEESGVEFALT